MEPNKNSSNNLKQQNGVKRDSKSTDKTEKNENKTDKVDRPVKIGKNKHSFVVAGILINY